MQLRIKPQLRGFAILGVSLGLFLSSNAGTVADGLRSTQPSRADGGGSTGASKPNPYARFPLWTDVPGGSFARLGEGELPNRTRWGVYVSKVLRGKYGRDIPCITVATITSFGEYGSAHECGRPTPAQHGPPLLMAPSGSFPSKSGRIIGEMVISANFTPEVASVDFRLADGTKISRATKLLTERQSKKTSLAKFRYVAFALMKDACVSSVVGYDESGERLFDLPADLGC